MPCWPLLIAEDAFSEQAHVEGDERGEEHEAEASAGGEVPGGLAHQQQPAEALCQVVERVDRGDASAAPATGGPDTSNDEQW